MRVPAHYVGDGQAWEKLRQLCVDLGAHHKVPVVSHHAHGTAPFLSWFEPKLQQ